MAGGGSGPGLGPGLGPGPMVPILPPPCPKSPPDLYGRRKEMARLQMLEREKGFLEEELKFVEGLQPASRCCKEIVDLVTANADPLITTNRKISKSCRFWKWLCVSSCFNLSWICCCCTGCSVHLKAPQCHCCHLWECCSCPSCLLPKCRCWCNPCPSCSTLKLCHCTSCGFGCPRCSNCCSCNCKCSCPKCSDLCACFSCRNNCCCWPTCCICC